MAFFLFPFSVLPNQSPPLSIYKLPCWRYTGTPPHPIRTKYSEVQGTKELALDLETRCFNIYVLWIMHWHHDMTFSIPNLEICNQLTKIFFLLFLLIGYAISLNSSWAMVSQNYLKICYHFLLFKNKEKIKTWKFII